MKRIILLFVATAVMTSCHRTTLEDNADKITSEFTERYCPTPVKDMQRTDSVTFNRHTHTFNYYFTLFDKADNPEAIKKTEKDISKELLKELKENTSFKVFKEAGYSFNYHFYSARNKKLLYQKMFTEKDYK